MKKLLGVLISCILVVVLVYASTTTNVIYKVVGYFINETEATIEIPSNNWYYYNLNEYEADIYKRIVTAIDNYYEKIVFLSKEKVSLDNIDRAFEAYLLDNADVFYVENQFKVNELQLPNLYKYEISITYTIDGYEQIDKAKLEAETAVNHIIANIITDNMNDFEKELAIHDYLVSNISYYKYDNIKDIPHEKHNIYSALVKKEAVCDGFSKSFQTLLEKVGIESITVTGKTENMNHAWNKVKLEGKWYNVDVTSDTIKENKLVTHIYFNIDDYTLTNTHTFNNNFYIPESNSNKYNYYTYLDYEIQKSDNLNTKLSKIINVSKNILEFKIIDEAYNKQEIVNNLYELNFNNYRQNNVQNIEYYYQNDIYVLVKNER